MLHLQGLANMSAQPHDTYEFVPHFVDAVGETDAGNYDDGDAGDRSQGSPAPVVNSAPTDTRPNSNPEIVHLCLQLGARLTALRQTTLTLSGGFRDFMTLGVTKHSLATPASTHAFMLTAGDAQRNECGCP